MEVTANIEVPLIRKELGIDINVKGYRVLIRAPIRKERSGSGVYLPGGSYAEMKERGLNFGLILKIGPTAFSPPYDDRKSEVGEWVFYSIYEREPIEPRLGIKCYVINDERILCGIPPEDLAIILEDFS